MQAIFFHALQSYSIVKHMHWIDFSNVGVLKACTEQLHYLGK